MFNLEFLDILNENSIVNDYNDANDKPGEPSISTVPDKKEKVGQRNLHTIAGAQYKAMAHFIENHIKTLHNHDNEDDIGIKVGDTTSMVKLKNIKTHITNEILTAHNKKLKASILPRRSSSVGRAYKRSQSGATLLTDMGSNPGATV